MDDIPMEEISLEGDASTSTEPDIFDQILAAEDKADDTRLGRILARIPGYKSYHEKEARRQADDLLRNTIAERMEETRLELSTAFQTMSKDIIMAIEYSEHLGRVNSRLAGLIAKIKDAPSGYASFYDAHTVDEKMLERIITFDEAFLDVAEGIADKVSDLTAAVNSGDGISAAIMPLDVAIQDAHLVFNARHELLSGFPH